MFASVYPVRDLLNRLDEKAARRNEAGAISFDDAACGHACRVRTCAVSNTCTIRRVRVPVRCIQLHRVGSFFLNSVRVTMTYRIRLKIVFPKYGGSRNALVGKLPLLDLSLKNSQTCYRDMCLYFFFFFLLEFA